MRQGHYYPRQHGAALIIVLGLLALSVILANSVMSSSLLNERIAGNYRAGVVAQMAMEAGIADAWGHIDGGYTRPTRRNYLAELIPMASLKPCDAVDWASLPTYWRSRSPANGFRRDVCREDVDGNGTDERYFVVTGFVGTSFEARIAERRERLRVEPARNHFATTNFIGGIALNASVQWPSSSASRIAGGTYDEMAIPAMYLEYDPQGGTYDRQGLWDSINRVNHPVIDGELLAQPTNADSLALIRDIYAHCYAPQQKNRCANVTIVPPGADPKANRADTMDGIYINLGGILDVRGNDVITGVAIVANVSMDPRTGAWSMAPNHTISLKGGGHAGSVRFDAQALNAALAGMRAQGLDLSLGDFFAEMGSHQGLVVRGWSQSY